MNTVIVKIYGGLGNQMFQYAAGRALALRTGAELFLDTTAFRDYTLREYELSAFRPECAEAGEELLRRVVHPAPPFRTAVRWARTLIRTGQRPVRKYNEPHFHFDPQMPALDGSVYLDGYWQSERYFQDAEVQLRKDLRFVQPLSEQGAHFERSISAVNSVSLHIRRGDYVSDNRSNRIHGVLDMDYYRRAVDRIVTSVPDPVFFLFSDDPVWAQEHVRTERPITAVGRYPGASGIEDLHLMSRCRHHIIANSSFSWWGAWLNPHPEKTVIAPRLWFNDAAKRTDDLFPPKWMVL